MMRGRLMGLGFVLLLALSACATTPAAVPAVYDLSQLSPLRLNVAHVAAADNAVGVSAHAITMMPDLKTRLNNWQQQRLQAAGADGQITLVIQQAEVVRQPLPLRQDLQGTFTRQQREQWQGTVKAEMQLLKPETAQRGFVSAEAARSTTLPEDATPAERQAAWNNLMNGLISDIDQQFEKNVRQHWSEVLVGQ